MGGEHEHESLSVTDLKILAIFIIFISGLIGALAPSIFAHFAISAEDDKEARKRKERRINLVIKFLICVSIGIIMATAFIHLLPHGVEELQESGNSLFKVEDKHEEEENHANETAEEHDAHSDEEHAHAYPFAYLFAMVSLVSVFLVSTEINWWGVRRMKALKGIACDEKEEGTLSAYIKLWVSQIGIMVHSCIIGITLGITKTEAFARTLLIVLVVHQLFEGLTVGTLVIAAHCSKLQTAFFVLLFAGGVPLGVGIGMGIQDNVDRVATGVLYSLSAGILIFVACVEMLPHIFGAHHHHAHGPVPFAEIHDHLHGKDAEDSAAAAHGHTHSHGHGHSHHDHSNEMKQKSENEPTEIKSSSPTNNASASAEIDGKKEEGEQNQQQQQQGTADAASPSAEDASPIARAAAHFHNDHEEDENAWYRIMCYFGIIVGCSIQSVLGIWA